MIAAVGRVKIQANKIPLTTDHWALRLTRPMPKSDPHETCVVETGNPNLEAKITNPLVTKLAVKPWP